MEKGMLKVQMETKLIFSIVIYNLWNYKLDQS